MVEENSEKKRTVKTRKKQKKLKVYQFKKALGLLCYYSRFVLWVEFTCMIVHTNYCVLQLSLFCKIVIPRLYTTLLLCCDDNEIIELQAETTTKLLMSDSGFALQRLRRHKAPRYMGLANHMTIVTRVTPHPFPLQY